MKQLCPATNKGTQLITYKSQLMLCAILQEDAIRSCVWEFIKLGALKVYSAPCDPPVTAKLAMLQALQWKALAYDAC